MWYLDISLFVRVLGAGHYRRSYGTWLSWFAPASFYTPPTRPPFCGALYRMRLTQRVLCAVPTASAIDATESSLHVMKRVGT
jgi:hypothetical protein